MATTTTELLVPAQPIPNQDPVGLIEPSEDAHSEPGNGENSTDYLPPDYVRMADRKDPLLALLADEDAIRREPSKHTISLLRRLMGTRNDNMRGSLMSRNPI